LMAAARAVLNRVYQSDDIVIVRATLSGPPAADRVGDVVFRPAPATDLDPTR
jgi:hypothetical protein